MTTALRMRQMFTRNFPDMSCILRFMTICDDAHDTRVPCYIYRAARVEEVFSSVIFVTPMTAKVLLCRVCWESVPDHKVTSIFTRKSLRERGHQESPYF